MVTSNTGLKNLLLPAFVAVLAMIAAVWAGNPAERAEAAPTALTVGLDMKALSGDSGTYNINSLPTFEQCVDVKTNDGSNGIFYIDIFVLNTSNLIAFNTDITFTSGKISIQESNVQKFFGVSGTIQNLSMNSINNPPNVIPPVTGGTFYAGAVDTGAGHTGHGVLSRIKAQGLIAVGGSVVDFRLDITPAISHGVTLTDSAGAHPGSGADGLFDGPFINQIGKIAVDRPDTDGDTVSNDCDNCPTTSNSSQTNTDVIVDPPGDANGDACDTDDDDDGVLDVSDNCPLVPNPTQDPAACADTDNDTILDGVDNCPTTANTNQANNDNDSQGDVCDADDDNDGVNDGPDNCDFTANPGQENFDGDAAGDACEDSDLDGWLDSLDNCKGLANPSQTNSETPTGDNYGDICDNCPTTVNNSQADWNTNFVGDHCEDFDIDVWKDVNELFSGTKANQKCASTTAINDEAIDSTLPDLNDNRQTNLSDIVAYGPHFNKLAPDPLYGVRYDFNMDARNNLTDIIIMGSVFNTTCTP